MARGASATSGRPRDARLAEAIATVCLLSAAGTSLSTANLQAALLVSAKRAEEILRALCGEMGVQDTAGGTASQTREETDAATDPILPLYASEDGRTFTRMGIEGGRRLLPLRLTPAQAETLDRALDRLGIPQANELRLSLRNAFWPQPTEASGEAAARDADAGTKLSAATHALLTCAMSIARAVKTAQPIVTFGYRGDNDLLTRGRRTLPQSLRLTDGRWAVDAYDLDARGTRTFLAERMTDAHLSAKTALTPNVMSSEPDCGYVRLICRGVARDVVASWQGARILASQPGQVTIEVPYYRGDWLPRHVLALGRDVTHDSELLTSEMTEIARLDLGLATKLVS